MHLAKADDPAASNALGLMALHVRTVVGDRGIQKCMGSIAMFRIGWGCMIGKVAPSGTCGRWKLSPAVVPIKLMISQSLFNENPGPDVHSTPKPK